MSRLGLLLVVEDFLQHFGERSSVQSGAPPQIRYDEIDLR